MADPQSILQLGIEAARAGDKAEARELFRLVTREDPNNAQGWLWLAGVAEDRAEKRAALERVVQLDPNNQLARKGLAALGGASTAAATPAAPATYPVPAVEDAAPPTPSPVDRSDPPFDLGTSVAAAAAPNPRRARVYDEVEPATTAPAFSDDDYDLSEYQPRPRAVADDPADENDRGAVVMVEDEEPRRRGLAAFLPLLLVLLLLLLGIFYLSRNFFGANTTAGGTNGTTTAASSGADPSAAGGVIGSTDGVTATDTVQASNVAAVPDASAPVASDLASAPPVAEASPALPEASAPVAEASVPPVEASAPPVAEQSAPPVAEQSAPPVAEQSAPPVEASAPPVAEQSAPPVPDVASANPAIVPNEQVLAAGPWEFGNSVNGRPISNVTPNAYAGVAPSRGRYLIALITVRNNSGAPAQIPDGFFVIKDAQGRTYDFNRAASADYFRRLPGAGDYVADQAIPPGGPLGSIPLLFDVNTDATDLVLFSRDNPSQGFLIRQNAQ